MLRIALDAMGGDHAPQHEIDGAIDALRRGNNRFEIALVGREAQLKSDLARRETKGLNLTVVHADDVVTMAESPASVVRSKPRSSLVRGLELHRDRVVDAFVSTGNTGAILSASTLILGRIPGVSRPAMGALWPNSKGLCFVLDVGASVDCKPRHLYEFAVMGSIFVTQLYHSEHPRVGLLSVGEEDEKGNEVTLAANALLRNSSLNFIGNVEGRDILKGTAEVVVCDGFAGNVMMKFTESVRGFLKDRFERYAAQSFINKLRIGLLRGPLKAVFSEFNYEAVGGLPLLGVNGVSVVGHGRSTPLAIANMILRAEQTALAKVNERIANALHHVSKRA